MIKSFRHKGLKRLFEQDDPSGVNPEHVGKLQNISGDPSSRADPCSHGFAGVSFASAQGRSSKRLLGGDGTRQLAVIFRFDKGAEDVDYVDYH